MRNVVLPPPTAFTPVLVDAAAAESVAAAVEAAGASPGPAVAATLVALIGLAIWVGAIVLLIRRGVEHSPRHRPAALSFAELILPALFVLGFALFLVGLRFT